MLKTLGNQTCLSVCPGEPIKFLLTQKWDMIFALPYEAFVIPKTFPMAPSPFGSEREQLSLVFSVFTCETVLLCLSNIPDSLIKSLTANTEAGERNGRSWQA